MREFEEEEEEEEEDDGTIRAVRVSNEMKFNFVNALTQFGERAGASLKSVVRLEVVDRRACKCNERGSGADAWSGAQRSTATRCNDASIRSLQQRGHADGALLFVAWRGTRVRPTSFLLFVTRPRFGWMVN